MIILSWRMDVIFIRRTAENFECVTTFALNEINDKWEQFWHRPWIFYKTDLFVRGVTLCFFVPPILVTIFRLKPHPFGQFL